MTVIETCEIGYSIGETKIGDAINNALDNQIEWFGETLDEDEIRELVEDSENYDMEGNIEDIIELYDEIDDDDNFHDEEFWF